jgi:hypothetical protein
MDDHCGTVTPVVSLPHDSVIVLVSKPLPMAWRTGGSASKSDARASGGSNDWIVVMPENVLLFCQQVRHRVTRRDVGQKPERVLEIRQQGDVRIWERCSRPGLELFHCLGRIAAADDVEPLLNVALVLELRFLPSPEASKKAFKSNSSNSPALRHRDQLGRHLIR